MATISEPSSPSVFKLCQCPSDIFHWYFFLSGLSLIQNHVTCNYNVSLVFYCETVPQSLPILTRSELWPPIQCLSTGFVWRYGWIRFSSYTFCLDATKVMFCLPQHTRRHMTSVWPVAAAGAVNRDHEFKVTAAGLFCSLISSSVP